MQEVGNCLRGIVQTPGSAGGHEAAKICVIYLVSSWFSLKQHSKMELIYGRSS